MVLYRSSICCGRRTYGVYYIVYPMYADVRRCVDMRQKEVNVCLAEVHPFTIDVVYTNILYAKAHLIQKIQNPKDPKSSSSTDSSSSTKYILEK